MLYTKGLQCVDHQKSCLTKCPLASETLVFGEVVDAGVLLVGIIQEGVPIAQVARSDL